MPEIDDRSDRNQGPERERILAAFRSIIATMDATFSSKDKAYAREAPLANVRRSSRIHVPPHIAAFIRMGDKYSRIESLLAAEMEQDTGFIQDAEKDESVRQNLLDLAVYAIIMIILKDEGRGATVENHVDESGRGHLIRCIHCGYLVESRDHLAICPAIDHRSEAVGEGIADALNSGVESLPPRQPEVTTELPAKGWGEDPPAAFPSLNDSIFGHR